MQYFVFEKANGQLARTVVCSGRSPICQQGSYHAENKVDYVISSLSPEVAMEVRDLLLRSPAEDPYTTLKTQLIKHTAALEQRKLQQLISGEELGYRKPTQLLWRMQHLLGEKFGASADASSFLRELFLQRLPPNVRIVLASTESSTTLEKLAGMVDKIMEVSIPNIATLTTPPSEHPEFQQLCEQVSRLTDMVASLS